MLSIHKRSKQTETHMNTATASAAEPESVRPARTAGLILIVDDDRNLVELVKMKLQAANYEVVPAWTKIKRAQRSEISTLIWRSSI